MKRRKRLKQGIIILAILLVVFAAVGLYDEMETTVHRVESEKLSAPVTLAVITDLHSCDYGEKGEKLVSAVEAEAPDVVLLVGDIIDDGLPWENGLATIRKLTSRFACYYVSGNHEYWTQDIEAVKSALSQTGVVILEGETIALQVNGQIIQISGIDDAWIGESEVALQLETAGEFDRSYFSVLMAHRPELIGQYLPYGYDLILSGHAHGGQIRLPFFAPQGLYAPDQGFFPTYSGGRWEFGQTTFLVSRGLSKETTRIPRFFNRRELIIVELVPIEES